MPKLVKKKIMRRMRKLKKVLKRTNKKTRKAMRNHPKKMLKYKLRTRQIKAKQRSVKKVKIPFDFSIDFVMYSMRKLRKFDFQLLNDYNPI